MKMTKPEMKVQRFHSEDVIATSGVVPFVYSTRLKLSGIGNDPLDDNLFTVVGGTNDGKTINPHHGNMDELVSFLNSSYDGDITNGTKLYREIHTNSGVYAMDYPLDWFFLNKGDYNFNATYEFMFNTEYGYHFFASDTTN